MNTFFRVDSSSIIGTGHLKRCLKIAQNIRDHEITFISLNLSGNINHTIPDKFNYVEFTTEDEIINFIKENKPYNLILDHYSINKGWEKKVYKYVNKLIVIDDLLREHYCHAILDQNIHPQNSNIVYKAKDLFLGPEFCILDKSFQANKPVKSNKILTFWGGADLLDISLKTLKLLQRSNIKNSILLTGPGYKYPKKLSSITNKNIKHLHNISKISELLSKTGYYFGSGGTITWERAYYGIPSFVVSVAKNQESINQELDKRGIIKYLGQYNEETFEDFFNLFIKYKDDQSLLKDLRRESLNLKVSSRKDEFINYLNN
jgi:UDP-2,4-diacetamido-2,4,6-trideoxy-beta-L-altropyranose hydrolase